MADDAARSRLGRGLAALIGDEETQSVERTRSQRRVPIEFIRPNPNNPRRVFSDVELDELAQSLRERGMIQPIVVRPVPGASDSYEIIAGERRWRAAQRASLHEIPIVVLDVSDGEALELAIIENVQRTDLNPLEEATGYQTLASQFNHSQDDIAQIVGKSRSHIANTLRLLRLPETVKAYINAGKLSAGHARALVNLPDPETTARDIVERGLNVREVEAIGQARAKAAGKKVRARVHKDADTIAMEKRVSDALGLSVSVDHRGTGGTVHIKYRDLDQLDEILRRLSRE
ncbi:MAG TPA: ParB/RepB/Spo0J family partition protein [Xanthobacteraceae bacterium]|nr:ParB/RepB/Spo0J family partition protein [Xanthobacteraceae bacterium]